MAGTFSAEYLVVTENGEPLEAQLENSEQGTYHGYPLPPQDPFRAVVLDNGASYDGHCWQLRRIGLD